MPASGFIAGSPELRHPLSQRPAMRRLFIRPGAIGDCLCWLPTLAAMRPETAEVWAPGPVLPLMELASSRRNLASTGFSLLGIPGVRLPFDLVESLRGFDEILSWHGANRPELREECESLRLPIRFFEPLPQRDSACHVSDWFLRQTSAWHGLDAEPAAWRGEGGRRFLLPSLDGNRPGKEPRVVIHPFSGSARKNWPIERYRRLARSIDTFTRGEVSIQWCAGPEDALPKDLTHDAWRFGDLDALARALSGTALFIGNDSGITHLAAILGVPCIVFFGPESPHMWSPRGARVQLVGPAGDGAPASEIPYEQGETAAFSVLRDLIGKCQ